MSHAKPTAEVPKSKEGHVLGHGSPGEVLHRKQDMTTVTPADVRHGTAPDVLPSSHPGTTAFVHHGERRRRGGSIDPPHPAFNLPSRSLSPDMRGNQQERGIPTFGHHSTQDVAREEGRGR